MTIVHRPPDFNPLHHEGGDAQDTCVDYPDIYISIHSTTRVETTHAKAVMIIRIISIHSTTRVETHVKYDRHISIHISIHSTTRVETESGVTDVEHYIHFNPLHHEGGDAIYSIPFHLFSYFNPLHHEGGDSNTTQ